MPTIKDAIEKAKRNKEWTITGMLLNKALFSSTETPFVMLVLLDEAGESIDFQAWGIEDQIAIYRKVEIGICCSVSGNGPIFNANTMYSSSDYEHKSRTWQVKPLDIYYSRNLAEVMEILDHGKCANMIATFVKSTPGPFKPSVQGYYVELMDEHNKLLNVLVWHPIELNESEDKLFKCKRGDTVLITSLRPCQTTHPAMRPNTLPIFTSNFSPVPK